MVVYMIITKYSNIKIGAVACAVPTHKDDILEKYASEFGVNEVEKFIKLTGIRTRYYAVKEQTSSDLCYIAAKNLMENEKTAFDPKSVGAIIYVSQTPDYIAPATAFVLHKRLNLSVDCIAFDVNLGCSGYVHGINLACSFINSSNISKVLLLVGDSSSKVMTANDKSSKMMFSDAGSATLIEKSDTSNEICTSFMSDGDRFKDLIIPAGRYRNKDVPNIKEVWADGIERSDYDLYMNGSNIFNFTTEDVPKFACDFLSELNKSVDDYDAFLLHQANKFILKQISKKTKMPWDKVPISIGEYGNTSSATIPITLSHSFNNNIDSGEINAFMYGFGAGLSWGIVTAKVNTDFILPVIHSDDYYTQGGIDFDNLSF